MFLAYWLAVLSELAHNFFIRHHRDILTDKDCEHVYELVYSSHRAVAQAAGEFLNERLFVPDEEAVAGIRTKRGKKRLPNTPLIRDLVQFFIESEVHISLVKL
jgi:cohesin complex subunit SA-1/2